jgi:hypothetical protein
LCDKSEVQGIFKKFARRAQNEFDVKIKRVRSDNGMEFKNTNIEELMRKESSMSFWFHTLYNKMVLWRGRTGHS